MFYAINATKASGGLGDRWGVRGEERGRGFFPKALFFNNVTARDAIMKMCRSNL